MSMREESIKSYLSILVNYKYAGCLQPQLAITYTGNYEREGPEPVPKPQVHVSIPKGSISISSLLSQISTDSDLTSARTDQILV